MTVDTASPARLIGVHGAPRSGTSWLGQLFNSSEHVAYRYQPFFSHAFRGRITGSSTAPEMRRVFREMLESRDSFLLQSGKQRLADEELEFPKSDISHLVYKEVRFHHLLPHLLQSLPDFKAVGIIRDPRAVVWSWANAPREFDPAWSLRVEWRSARKKNAGLDENWYGFERWKELALLFLKLESSYPDRFCTIRYERLVWDMRDEIESIFDFCDLPVSEQTVAFVRESTTRDDRDTYGVHRGHSRMTGQEWQSRLDREISRQITEELLGTPLEEFLHGDST
ncbi:MAG TPA: sulfotransferase [Gammaproteobacteria bacterium]|nr:sulfotransferase [Gammaproteobacteria bacterium]